MLALIDAVTDDLIAMKLEAAIMLGQIGPEAKKAVDALKAAALEDNAPLAEEALRALVKIEKDALPAGREILANDNAKPRQARGQRFAGRSAPRPCRSWPGCVVVEDRRQARRQSAQARSWP